MNIDNQIRVPSTVKEPYGLKFLPDTAHEWPYRAFLDSSTRLI